MRRGAQRLLIAGLVVAAGVLVPLLVTSAGAKTDGPRAVASQSYTDPGGDSGNAPDLIGATLSDDSDGTLHFTVSYLNRHPCIATPDYFIIGIDSDQNSGTGTQGFDYLIQVNGDHSATLLNGSQQPVTSSTLSASCGSSGDDVAINRSDVGVAAGGTFGLGIESVQGGDIDIMPDSGEDSYTVSAAPPPPRLRRRPAHRRPQGRLHRLAHRRRREPRRHRPAGSTPPSEPTRRRTTRTGRSGSTR